MVAAPVAAGERGLNPFNAKTPGRKDAKRKKNEGLVSNYFALLRPGVFALKLTLLAG